MSSIQKDSFVNLMQKQSIHPNAITNFCNHLDEFNANKSSKISFASVTPINPKLLFLIESLNYQIKKPIRCALLKLNGGLGTSMGCKNAKSALKVKDNDTFIDIIIKSIANSDYHSNPLCFMNSYNTHSLTETLCIPYKGLLELSFFVQNKVPRISKNTLSPCSFEDQHLNWNPPGHGDVYFALEQSGQLKAWLDKGIEYCFISNADNLGASFDPKIPQLMAENQIDFLMECTAKTELDKKGGIPCLIDSQLSLLEVAQVNDDEYDKFYDLKQHPYFNTNNIWIHLPSLQDLLNQKKLKTHLIVNPKIIHNQSIIQLESAMGSAINCFKNAALLKVNRDRFLPVKTTRDLLYLRSNAIEWNQKKITCTQETPTAIDLSDEYSKVSDLERHFPFPLDLKEAKTLCIQGPFIFGNHISFSGENTLINSNQKAICIDDHNHFQDVALHTNPNC